MIFADKLIALRRQSGWSQEELAQQLGVTRQSVSKWEGAQAVPELDKILQLSRLFGVSVDYLLKDELEQPGPCAAAEEPSLRRVSMEEANAFLAAKEQTAGPMALGIALCILSPVCLFFLTTLAEFRNTPLSENAAAGIGLTVLLVMVAAAVAIFLSIGGRTGRFEYLEKEAFEPEYGVEGMVRQRQQAFAPTHTRGTVFGVMLCILSVVPLFGWVGISEDELWMTGMLCLLLVLVAIGVAVLVWVGIPWESMQKLLQEGDYTPEKKARSPWLGAVSAVYWLVAVALFLGYSFITNDWDHSWILWPVAGVLFPAVLVTASFLGQRKR